MVRAVVTREDSDLLELRAAILERAPEWDPEIIAEVDAIAVRSGDLGFVDALPLPLVRVPPAGAPLRVLTWYLVRRAWAGFVAGVALRVWSATRWRMLDRYREQASLADRWGQRFGSQDEDARGYPADFYDLPDEQRRAIIGANADDPPAPPPRTIGAAPPRSGRRRD